MSAGAREARAAASARLRLPAAARGCHSSCSTARRSMRATAAPTRTPDGQDWPDNALRFGVLSRAAALLGGARTPLDWRPDDRALQRLADGARAGVPARRARARGRGDDHPQPRLPGKLFDARCCAALELAAGGVLARAARVLRPALVPERRHVLRRRHHHRQPDLCARDPDRRARLRPGRRCCATRRDALQRHPERHRHRVWDPASDARIAAALRRGQRSSARPRTRPRCSGACNWSCDAGVPLARRGLRASRTRRASTSIAARGRRARRAAGAARRARQGRARAGARARGARRAPSRARSPCAVGVRRGPRAPHRGGRRPLPDAVALRALRAEPDVQPALRHAAGGARDRRPGRYRRATARPAFSSSAPRARRCSRRCAARSRPTREPAALARDAARRDGSATSAGRQPLVATPISTRSSPGCRSAEAVSPPPQRRARAASRALREQRRVVLAADRPAAVPEVEARPMPHRVLLRGGERRQRADVAPVGRLLVLLQSRHRGSARSRRRRRARCVQSRGSMSRPKSMSPRATRLLERALEDLRVEQVVAHRRVRAAPGCADIGAARRGFSWNSRTRPSAPAR